MYILGISCYYHDSAAALLKDGEVIAAAEEERFTRKKHDNGFPENTIRFCLKTAGIAGRDLNHVVFYEKPLAKFDRILQTSVETWPSGMISFWKAIPSWLDEKLAIERTIRKKTGYEGRVLYCDHHTSHAASAFFVSPFQRAAIMTIDGVGEWTTTSLKLGDGSSITPLAEMEFPNSIGLLYSTITSFLGFRVNDDEYKVMGLASYGSPKYLSEFSKIVQIDDDGSFRLAMKYFDFRHKSRMWSKRMEELLGPPRKGDQDIDQRHKDIASTLQKVTEDAYVSIANHLHSITNEENLCIAGGVGLNCIANGKLFERTPFKRIFIQPNAGDAGGALGSAYFVWNQVFGNSRAPEMKGSYYGPEFGNDYIKAFLDESKVNYEFMDDDMLVRNVAKLLSDDKVVGWFQGRLEWGPRALGNRSILANPKPDWMKDRVNEIKRREKFRPFAGSVLQERVHEFFDVPEKEHRSPFMNFAFRVKDGKENAIKAIVHVDGTCRIQTVAKADNDAYYNLIKEFGNLTGTPVVLNTSFNLRGEPIVCRPEEAYADFIATNMDYLVLGNCLVTK